MTRKKKTQRFVWFAIVLLITVLLLYTGRLGAGAPYLSHDFPIWGAITSGYRELSEIAARFYLWALDIDPTIAPELMPLDFIVEMLGNLVPFFLICSWILIHHPNRKENWQKPENKFLQSKIVMFLLIVISITFLLWGIGGVSSLSVITPENPNNLLTTFPFYSFAEISAEIMSPSRLYDRISTGGILIVVSFFGFTLSTILLRKSIWIGALSTVPFTLILIRGTVLFGAAFPAAIIQMNQFADQSLAPLERFVAALGMWLNAATA